MDTVDFLLTDAPDLSNAARSQRSFDISVQRQTPISVFSRPGTSCSTVTFHVESVQCFCGSELKRCLSLSKNRSHVIKMMDQLIMTRLMLCGRTSADHIGFLLEGKLLLFFSLFFCSFYPFSPHM